MEHKTKEYYRNVIKEIAKKTNMSEIYIAKKTIELRNQCDIGTKQSHIGYYLIDEGREEFSKLVFSLFSSFLFVPFNSRISFSAIASLWRKETTSS